MDLIFTDISKVLHGFHISSILKNILHQTVIVFKHTPDYSGLLFVTYKIILKLHVEKGQRWKDEKHFCVCNIAGESSTKQKPWS